MCSSDLVRIELDEDALTRTNFGGLHDREMIALFDSRETSRTAGIVQRNATLGHVGNSVFQLHEHVRAVVDAQAVTGAQVLVDPHAHRANVTGVSRTRAK